MKPSNKHHMITDGSAMVKDSVCGMIIDPETAAAMSFSSVTVISNALRLKRLVL